MNFDSSGKDHHNLYNLQCFGTMESTLEIVQCHCPVVLYIISTKVLLKKNKIITVSLRMREDVTGNLQKRKDERVDWMSEEAIEHR